MFSGGVVVHLFQLYFVLYYMNSLSEFIHSLDDGHLNLSILIYEKTKVAKTFLNLSSGGHMHSFLLSKYLRVELLSHGIGICPALVAIPKQLTKVLVAFSTPISNVCGFQLIEICINT